MSIVTTASTPNCIVVDGGHAISSDRVHRFA
jgi:hypothetical protein